MVTPEHLEARRLALRAAPDLEAALGHVRDAAAPVLARMPHVPERKALLSVDGGVCPADGEPLAFDPWSPGEHRCRRCGQSVRGERHDGHWARFQHLWLAERAAHLATLAALDDSEPAGRRAREILTTYAARYLSYPNRDNVLGPARLFFSTYLESIWILNYVAAAVLLREAGALEEAPAAAVSQVADEAANLIGEYDERFSNRQTWNNAALAAIAVWFEDEDLARRAIEGPTGLIAHLRGYRDDGLWYEGENYHLFALRGLVAGAAWARLAGVDFFAEPRLRQRVMRALQAPALTALPDATFPARKDSRFGVSLAQPAYLETWEVALGLLANGDEGRGTGELVSWLRALYESAPVMSETFDYYLHDAGPEAVARAPSRRALSWWSLLEMLPELPPAESAWSPPSVLLPGQGLAVLRTGGRYVSLECGPLGGGHGHPDRLHLTLHALGVHWLPDFGTRSYVSRDLFWYRSPLSHNAPIVDGDAEAWRDAGCERFDVQGDWSWTRGRSGAVTRTVVSGPRYVVDIVELSGDEERTLDLPWHVRGRWEVDARGRWETVPFDHEFVTDAGRFVPDDPAEALVVRAAADAAEARLVAHVASRVELWRGTAPDNPRIGAPPLAPFFWLRARGKNIRLVTVLEPSTAAPAVRAVRVQGDTVSVETTDGIERHELERDRWIAAPGSEVIRLGGPVEMEPPFRPLLDLEPPSPATGVAYRVEPPPLDGSLDGFDTSDPLHLDLEDQYRRSEETYAGPEEFSARAYAAWDDDALYLAVAVTKAELVLRPPDAPPLRLDNEPDDIHSDGIQVYVQGEEGRGKGEGYVGYLIVPEEGGALRVRAASGAEGDPQAVRGAWRRTDTGYCVTLAIPWPRGYRPHFGARPGFDLIANEMRPGRVRRAGQLVWSGGNGWVWLRGDRQEPERFGVLELVG